MNDKTMEKEKAPGAVFLVGGAVRDACLNLEVKDRDWVVVGATSQDMEAAGFLQVGKDFPVFLSPKTKEEYALARTERKNGTGYRGFEVSHHSQVTLSEDLERRDLTINAMALPLEYVSDSGLANGFEAHIIDPFGGRKDLEDGILRHTSMAFQEDPVRVLRVARLMARMPRFEIEESTLVLMRNMVKGGELDALVKERLWKEWSRGMMEQAPHRMLNTLRECGAMDVLVPELGSILPDSKYKGVLNALSVAVKNKWGLGVRMACLNLTDVTQHFVVPAEVLEICAEVMPVQPLDASAEEVFDTLERLDVWRRPSKFEGWIRFQRCMGESFEPEKWQKAFEVVTKLQTSTEMSNGVSFAEQMKREGVSGKEFGFRLRMARLDALRESEKRKAIRKPKR
jgi:tRNA nucleotidyltransferase (CCA-adding enzyme)